MARRLTGYRSGSEKYATPGLSNGGGSDDWIRNIMNSPFRPNDNPALTAPLPPRKSPAKRGYYLPNTHQPFGRRGGTPGLYSTPLGRPLWVGPKLSRFIKAHPAMRVLDILSQLNVIMGGTDTPGSIQLPLPGGWVQESACNTGDSVEAWVIGSPPGCTAVFLGYPPAVVRTDAIVVPNAFTRRFYTLNMADPFPPGQGVPGGIAGRWIRGYRNFLSNGINPTWNKPRPAPYRRWVPHNDPWGLDPFQPPDGLPRQFTRPLPWKAIPYRPDHNPDRSPHESSQSDNGGPAPVPTNPPWQPPPVPPVVTRPPARTKEAKFKLTAGIVGRVFGGFTEFSDFIESLYDALPCEARGGKEIMAKSGGGAIKTPGFGATSTVSFAGAGPLQKVCAYVPKRTLSEKFAVVYENLHKIDPTDAVKNLILNQIEDAIIGKLGSMTKAEVEALAELGLYWSPKGLGFGPAL